MKSLFAWLMGVLLLAAACYLSGMAALMTALSPGFSAPLWPPAGIALATFLSRGWNLWPGFAIAMLLLDGGNPQLAESPYLPLIMSIMLAAGIGQALAATLLIRWWVGWPSPLWKLSHVLGFLILGGPVACLVSSTVCVATLVWFDHITMPLFHWFTWWVGDSLGVLVIAPVTLCVLGWRDPSWIGRRLAIIMPLLAALVLITQLFASSIRDEHRKIRTAFHNQSESVAVAMQDTLSDAVQLLLAIRGLDEASEDLTESEFNRFAQTLLAANQGVELIGYSRIVPHPRRADYERDFATIWESPATEASEPADVRLVHAPLAMCVAEELSIPRSHFDLASVEPIGRSLDRVVGQAHAIASGVGEFPFGESRVTCLTLISPSEDLELMSDTPTEAHTALGHGYVKLSIVTMPLAELLEAAESGLTALDGNLTVWEIGSDTVIGPRRRLFSTIRPGEDATRSIDSPLALPLEVANRTWLLEFTLPTSVVEKRMSWQFSLVLGMGLLAGGLLSAVVLAGSGRAKLVEQSVVERTAELTRSYERLENEVAFRRRAEAELVSHSAALESANRSMQLYADAAREANEARSRFLAQISHELRNPLAGMLGYADAVTSGAASQNLPASLVQSLKTLREQGDFVIAILDDLTEIARSDMTSLSLQRIDTRLTSILGEVLARLRPKAEMRGLVLRSEFDGPVPAVIHTDQARLRQVLTSLIGQAMRDMEGGEVGLVVRLIEKHGEPPLLEFAIVGSIHQDRPDLGPLGVAHGSIDGLGIAVSTRLAEILGGDLVVERDAGKPLRLRLTIDPGPLEGVSMILPSGGLPGGKSSS
jgi:signal transduction histidine kinase